MNTRRWDPFALLSGLDREFEDIVRRTWSTTPALPMRTGYVPATDVVRAGDDVLVRLELPGISEEDLDIEVHDGRLTVSGERKESSETSTDGTLVREMRYGSFRRDFALPEGVGAEDVTAEYDKGILELRIHQAVRHSTPRKVSIASRSALPSSDTSEATGKATPKSAPDTQSTE